MTNEENIEMYKEKHCKVTDQRLYWQAKQHRNDDEMLKQELCNLQRKIGLDPLVENVSKF